MMIIIMSIINDHDLFDSIIDYKRDLSIIKIMNFFALKLTLNKQKTLGSLIKYNVGAKIRILKDLKRSKGTGRKGLFIPQGG